VVIICEGRLVVDDIVDVIRRRVFCFVELIFRQFVDFVVFVDLIGVIVIVVIGC